MLPPQLLRHRLTLKRRLSDWKMQISQSREGANISDLAFDRPAVAHAECNASIEELIAEMAAIRKSNEDARLQIHELETVLRARTQ